MNFAAMKMVTMPGTEKGVFTLTLMVLETIPFLPAGFSEDLVAPPDPRLS